jgi:hypothetical protein
MEVGGRASLDLPDIILETAPRFVKWYLSAGFDGGYRALRVSRRCSVARLCAYKVIWVDCRQLTLAHSDRVKGTIGAGFMNLAITIASADD